MEKKLILFGFVGWNIAETTRMIEIAKRASQDFKIVFASYGGQFNQLVEDAGFNLIQLHPTETPEKIELLWKIDRGEKFAHPFSYNEIQERVKHEISLFNTYKPVAVVMGSVLTFSISARITNIPLVNVIPFALSRGYFENKLPMVPEFPAWLNRLFSMIICNIPLLTKNFSKVARQYGLPSFKSFVSIWEGDYNLVTDLPSLFKGVVLQDNWQFVGPIYAKLEREVPKKVIDFLNEAKNPTVYFAMGSSANKEVLQQVLESFEGLPVSVIAPIKSYVENSGIAIPSNMLVTDWLPAHIVNPLCTVAVIHGGQGTVQTACDSGTPFIGIGMQPEQSINIESVARFGSAIRIARRKFSKHLFKARLNELLTNPTFTEKAKELQKESRQIHGAENVAKFLVNICKNGTVRIPKTPYTAHRLYG